jgi:phosphoheptose isomerase
MSDYAQALRQALDSVPEQSLKALHDMMLKCRRSGHHVYVAGNGGSAAIADHLCCDWLKGTHKANRPPLRVKSLMANGALLTALSNDFGYEKALAKHIEMVGQPGDLLVVISSSGNSANVIEAAKIAREKQMGVFGLVGFSGGALPNYCDHSIHIAVENYGVVEDAHQAIMHTIAQFTDITTS